jgi:hypothetical protein
MFLRLPFDNHGIKMCALAFDSTCRKTKGKNTQNNPTFT